MSHKLQAPRGTKDLYPCDYRKFRHVVDTAESIAKLYGFDGIMTPIIEHIEVFQKSLGETSDVVGKEMYVFEDRGGELICLRPEFTAGIARSFISSGMQQYAPFKLFAAGPLFRYERPQKGRQRQFHQINAEILGMGDPNTDVELIAMADHLLDKLAIKKYTSLEINSLADTASRSAYRDALVDYLSGYKNDLSADSQKRLEKNPMRILDSKDEQDQKIVADAPKLPDFYSDDSKAFFDSVLDGLNTLGIAYTVKPTLVRGLDYYCHTAFEFTTNDLGAQNAVIAGGRYDGLIGSMGGPETPAIGFAGGIERMVALLEQTEQQFNRMRGVVLMPMGDKAQAALLELANNLRHQGIKAEMLISGNIRKRMKKADQKNATHVLILGEDELVAGQVTIKDMQHGNEEKIPLDGVIAYLKKGG